MIKGRRRIGKSRLIGAAFQVIFVGPWAVVFDRSPFEHHFGMTSAKKYSILRSMH